MRNFYALLFVLSTLLAFGQKNPKTIGFIENKGQIVDQKRKANTAVRYLLNTPGLNVQLRNGGFSYDLYEMKKVPVAKKKDAAPFGLQKELPDYTFAYNYHRIDIEFLNANASTKLVAEGKSKDYDNYYNVVHAPEGITGVHKYKKVTYQNLYNNIDVLFFVPNDSTKAVEYNFIVRPGGKVSDIQLRFKGAKTELADDKIRMQVRFGELQETLPLSWIESGTSRKEIAMGFRELKKNVYGIAGDVGASDETIVIDPTPVRLWGTYYGDHTNTHYTQGDASLTTDSLGNPYMSGSTSAINTSYATAGAHQTSIPQDYTLDTNGIIVKFDPLGNRLWGTYYGGTKYTHINSIKTDSQNNVFVTGITEAETNISTPGSHKPNLNDTWDSDAFLVKFNALGVRIWGTYFGGDDDDPATALAIDHHDNIYIVGTTLSQNGIAFNSSFQSQLYDGPQYDIDGYVAKFNTNGVILWGTYAGGDHMDHFTAVAVKDNYVVVGGDSMSFNNISTPGVFQQNHDLNIYSDAVVYKFTDAGVRLWSTYYGGDYTDYIYSIAVDDEHNIYFGGETGSDNNIATPGSFESSNESGYNGFLGKLNSSGSRVWGTYLHGAELYSIIFRNNSIYIGATHSSWIVGGALTNSCSYRPNGNSEGYIGKFSKSGALLWGTFVGGRSTGQQTVIALDPNNDIYVAGQTSDTPIDTGIVDSNSYQSTILGYFTNYFMMKFDESDLCSMEFQPTTNALVCASQTISFSNIPSGYDYAWSGPNGFSSSQQYPTISSANAANSGAYTLVISDGDPCNCQKTYIFNIVVQDNAAPIPTIAALPTINGDCHTIISTIPTATDNCAGTITATTTNPLSYSVPGTYTIVWNYNDGNGNTATQNQIVIVSATSIPTVNANYYYCPNETPAIAAIPITGQNIQWYDAQTEGNLLQITTLLQNGVTYYASQTINGCESIRVPVIINIQNTPAPIGNANQSFCSSQNATLNDIAISGTDIIWYDSVSGTTILPSSTMLANNRTYYATQTLNSCESSSRLAVTVTLINTLNASNYSETLCDDLNNGLEILNLSNYNSQLISNTANMVFTYYNSYAGAENQTSTALIANYNNYSLTTGTSIIYVRIDSSNGCHQVVALQLTLASKPAIPIPDTMALCDGTSVTVSPGVGFDSYLWSTNETSPSITITAPGTYSVTVSENHGTVICSSVKSFTVISSNLPTISEVITSDWSYNQNTITVLLNGNNANDYMYSLDGIHYQSDNTFIGLQSGEYTVFVKNLCGVNSEDFYLLMYPKFFTPNSDGYNDYWKIRFSENETALSVKIFDRYGKLMKELGATSSGWDGTYLGKPLPSNDYWFLVTRQNGKEYRGHFTLKR